MENTGYVALSHAAMMERATDITANNIANSNTVGFRSTQPLFESLVVDSGGPEDLGPLIYATETGTVSDLAPGALMATGNPLDVALPGGGWMAYRTPEGQIALGRDGQLALTAEGDLVTGAGDFVLDVGGAPISLPPDSGALTIADDGTITAPDGGVLGQIGIFDEPGIAGWQHLRGALLVPREGSVSLTPALDPVLKQGVLEQSNVAPIAEMTRLISQQRAYERAMSLASVSDDLRKETLSRVRPS
ncbi:flagellar hook basal-body protein [Tabrizicola sp.]|uniref:flagellar hook basal-body protein n=1 Tax=Tabrizicola sp. TaxID=2005166 RepID=UPI0035AE6ED4